MCSAGRMHPACHGGPQSFLSYMELATLTPNPRSFHSLRKARLTRFLREQSNSLTSPPPHPIFIWFFNAFNPISD